jgi:hypothetical protein
MVNRFIYLLQVVTTNNYNNIADFHTTNHSTLKSSQSTFTSLYLATALRLFLCSVFTRRFLVTNHQLRCPVINAPQLNPQLNSTQLNSTANYFWPLVIYTRVGPHGKHVSRVKNTCLSAHDLAMDLHVTTRNLNLESSISNSLPVQYIFHDHDINCSYYVPMVSVI